MSEGFKVADNLTLPLKAAKQVTSMIGKRESGKTYNGGDFAEEIMKAGIPIVVIDGMGIWWSLRVAVKYVHGKQVPDPTRPGFPVVVFGGDHADIPLPMMRGQRIPLVPDPEKIRLMATSIVESGISAVIDTSDLPSKTQEMTVVTEFIPALQRANKNYGVRTIFIEEAELWAPQQPMHDEAMSLHVMNNLVKRGGNWNLGCVMLSQRAADFNKRLLTQSDMLCIGRLSAPQDKDAIQDWVRKATETEESKKELNKWYDSLNELAPGEMWVWKPDPPKIRIKTRFRLRETLHATREFLESPEVRKVAMLGIDEYKAKFLKIFEPPKPAAKTLPVPEQKKFNYTRIDESVIRLAQAPLKSIPVPGQEVPLCDSNVKTDLPTMKQSYPTLIVQRERMNLLIPQTLQEPQSAEGRLAVALANAQAPRNRDDSWSIKAFKEKITDHGWSVDASIDEAIAKFIQWEIIQKLPSKYFRLNRERIRIVDINVEMQAQ